MVSKNIKIYGTNTIGQVFTPDYIAEFMVKNVLNFTKENKKNLQDFKVLEPSAGEGVFLKHLQNEFPSIEAFEMDLSLKKTLLNSFPTIKFRFENFLGANAEEKFDLIIGNPPYLGQNYNSKVFQEYVKSYPICKKYFVGNMDLFYYFIHLGIEKLNPGGLLSYITTNYWVAKSQKTGIKLLKPHILNECYLLQYIDLANLNIFNEAKGQHNCIFVLQKKVKPEKPIKKNDRKNIQIIQISGLNSNKQVKSEFNKRIFLDLIRGNSSPHIRKYDSALANSDLKENESWNLLYPHEMKVLLEKIENRCKIIDKLLVLQDFFIIRNGLILINDNIFILEVGKELKIESKEFYIKIASQFIKLTKIERSRLKKVYKSKSIKPYGFDKTNFMGYLIYFNKYEFSNYSAIDRNKLIEKKYPTLIKYLNQYKSKLREILVNAKENPDDLYYPRRGALIRRVERSDNEKLVDLEHLYDSSQKIFFKYISERNIFGYSKDSYYATSDTYFLWPQSHKRIDYLFMLAYLNSRLVSFIFKGKNIIIKRSKTKLERGLPIPNYETFKEKRETEIITLIKELTSYLINNTLSDHTNNIGRALQNLTSRDYINISDDTKFKLKIVEAIEQSNEEFIKNSIDTLFFELFQLNENEINNLLNEYYDLSLN
ncbi:MAG: Eco57I restriction-modification methylase domain-containing protein [Candidatus Heimdallarchaeota archaeon]